MRRLLLGSLVLVGCLVGGLAFADDGNTKTYQTVNMVKPGDGMIPSAATLVRSKHGVEMRVVATLLDQNSAYTAWWVVFNNPAACLGPCGPPSFGVPAVRASVFYAAGFVTGNDGTATITAHVEDGKLPIGLEVTPDGTVAGLDRGNGFGAMVWVVVRAHGPVITGMADKQIGSFDGGCPPNTCMNQQIAMFPAVAVPHHHDDDED